MQALELERVNRHIVDTEERIAAQRARLAQQRAADADSQQSRKLLAAMLDSLDLLLRRRRLIIQALAEQHALRHF